MKTSIYMKLVKRQKHTSAFKELLEIKKSKETEKIKKKNMTACSLQKQSSVFSKNLIVFAIRTGMNMNQNNFQKNIQSKRMPRRSKHYLHFNCFRIKNTKQKTN